MVALQSISAALTSPNKIKTPCEQPRKWVGSTHQQNGQYYLPTPQVLALKKISVRVIK